MFGTRVDVRRGRTTDTPEILHFFTRVRRRYVSFGDEDLPWLLRHGLVFVAEAPPLLWGVLVVKRTGTPHGFIRALGLIDGWPAEVGVHTLLAHAYPVLQQENVEVLHCILTETWLHAPLEANGFTVAERIITLLRHTRDIPRPPAGPARLRLVRPDELPQVAAVDAAAFPPPWQYTRAVLAAMLTTGGRMTVAEVDGALVGYACAELRGDTGHIARLAVHPDYQNRGIGRQLLLDAMHYLAAAGATRLTLNTQQTNRPALHLYETLQFRRFGRAIPVMEKRLR